MNIRQKKKKKKKKNKVENGMGISKVSVGNTNTDFFYLSGKITPNNGVFSLQKPLTCTLC